MVLGEGIRRPCSYDATVVAEYPIRRPNSSRSRPARTRSVFIVCPNVMTTAWPDVSAVACPASSASTVAAPSRATSVIAAASLAQRRPGGLVTPRVSYPYRHNAYKGPRRCATTGHATRPKTPLSA